MKSVFTIVKTAQQGGGWLVKRQDFHKVQVETASKGEASVYEAAGKATAEAYTALYHARSAIGKQVNKPRIRFKRVTDSHYTYEHEN